MSDLPRTFDVVVVGGGLLGCASAFYLARAGSDVALFERGDVNGQASTQNAGSLHFQLRGHAMSSQGEEIARKFALTFPLIEDAQRRWSTLESELDQDLEVETHGGLMVAESPEEAALLEKKAAVENDLGLPTRVVDGHEARRLEPSLSEGVLAASWCAQEGHADPRLVAPAFIRRAVEMGALAETHTAVTGLGRDGHAWRLLRADGRETHARAVLVAAGAWTADVLGLADVRLPVTPVALNMCVTQRTAPLLTRLIQHSRRRLTLKQVRAGNVLIGGGWPSSLEHEHGVPDKDRSPAPILESIVGNTSIAAQVVPAVRSLQMLRCWTGMQGVPPDHLPTLGEIPRRPGLFVANADVVGFSLGPAYAGVVSDLILGRELPFPVDRYSPKRFEQLNYV